MKIIKNNIKFIIGFIVGIVAAGGIVYAAVSASEVNYTKEGTAITNVEQALNDLSQNKIKPGKNISTFSYITKAASISDAEVDRVYFLTLLFDNNLSNLEPSITGGTILKYNKSTANISGTAACSRYIHTLLVKATSTNIEVSWGSFADGNAWTGNTEWYLFD